jgi:hypothetical protein
MRTAAALCLAFALAVPAFAADNPPACNLNAVLPPSKDTVAFENALRSFVTAACYDTLGWTHDPFIRDTGPYVGGNYYGTHPAVRIWYSPEVASWMKLTAAQRAVTPIADNAVIVKEMYAGPANCYPTQPNPPKLDVPPPAGCFPSPFQNPQTSAWWTVPGQAGLWTVMVRDAKASLDGWYWSFYFTGADAVPTNAGNTTFPSSGFGNYCINCHASAASNSTYSTERNVEGTNTITYLNTMLSMANPTPHSADSHKAKAQKGGGPILGGEVYHNDLLHTLAPWWQAGDPLTYRSLPGETWDHVMAMKDGPPQFVTSDQCIGCHDATSNIAAYPANMIYPVSGSPSPAYNVSPYGEWRASLMGLSGRDPVFFSQIASELTIHPNAKLPTTIPNICFRCHGAMGQRQITLDNKGPFDPEMIYAWSPSLAQPEGNNKYGALARDSISCTLCHHISDKDLGQPKTFTGQFNTTDPKTIIGPFADPQAKPMNHALDMTPVHTEYVKESRLCGSCHTVELPVLNSKGVQVKTDFEQTTYFEWQNSVFQNEKLPANKDAQSCQDCHMPSTFKLKEFKSQDLAYRIANMEDNTYPYVDDRLPDKDISLQTRTGYARHTLVGINLFVQEMFLQFSDLLGIRTTDPMVVTAPDGSAVIVKGLKLAEQATIDLARRETATVEVVSMKKTATDLEVRVRVKNNAGHSFPSGVSFRRAFLDFEVFDGSGMSLWASGATNQFGMITNGPGGAVLPTEFLEGGQFQDHHTVITDQSQVQIYEELVKDPEGHFTTSFLSLFNNIKKNRLLPRGWNPVGPHADATKPHGSAAKDPDYFSGCGCDTIIYKVPLSKVPNAATVRAQIFYQTIPPYFLRQRFTDTYDESKHTAAENTQRLMDFVRKLNVTTTEIQQWKLFVAGTTRSITD